MAQSTITDASIRRYGARSTITAVAARKAAGIKSTITNARAMVVGGGLSFTLGAAAVVNPFYPVPVTASVISGSVTTWVFSAVDGAGATVALTGTGGTRTYRAPATVAGTTVTTTVRGQNPGQPDVVRTRTDTIRPHAGWFRRVGGVLVGLELH